MPKLAKGWHWRRVFISVWRNIYPRKISVVKARQAGWCKHYEQRRASVNSAKIKLPDSVSGTNKIPG